MMREPRKEIISKENNSSVIATEYGNVKINVPWHNHTEIEVVYIKQGAGTAIVADMVLSYQKGNVFLVGKNVPHSYQSEDDEQIHSVFQINPSLLEGLREFSEFENMHKVLNNSLFGIIIKNGEHLYTNYLVKILAAHENDKPLKIIDFLNNITQNQYEKICNIPYYSEKHNTRMEVIYNYILENFSKDISLDDVALSINLSKTAFCNYFKKKTGKTFSAFLNEIRINKACMLLVETDSSIAEICFNCGFNSLSYFNKVFQKTRGMSPLTYKKLKANV